MFNICTYYDKCLWGRLTCPSWNLSELKISCSKQGSISSFNLNFLIDMLMFRTTKLFYFVLSSAKTNDCNVRSFQAIQDSSIGDIVIDSLSQWVTHLLISAKILKDNERQWKTMKDNEKQWKTMKTMKDNERHRDRDRNNDSDLVI